MNLSQLLQPWIKQEISDCVVSGLHNDSRQVQAGDLFIAYPGAAADGRLFIEKAVAAGAVAVAYDPAGFLSSALPDSVPCVPIEQLSEHLGDIAKRFYHNPSASLQVTGVTGTNGKTTIAYQLAQAHHLLGQGAAYIGTIGRGAVNALKPLNMTTPDALYLEKLMHEYNEADLKQVCMEVSSHALSQHRVDAVVFKQAIFTNLTLDHLDYHHTMQNYAKAKSLLFARPELEYAILNHDDPYQKMMAAVLKPQVKKLTYGMQEGSDIRAISWNMTIDGTEIEVQSPWGSHLLKITALGEFNIYNTLALFTSLMTNGYAAKQVVAVIAQLKAAPGRMEIVASAPYVLVDYAHTPDALKNVLITLNQLKKGRLWVVFGCGGDRDKTKRPIMGQVAREYADAIVITSDNPRTEDPEVIVEEVANGIRDFTQVSKIINREEAIRYATENAAKEDIILIAGKGHEAYQQIGTVKHAFSDQELVKRLTTV